MRERWFGDDRDVVKWTTLLHLAREHDLPTIVYAPYWRPEPAPRVVMLGENPIFVPDEVWRFFRDFRRIRQLSKSKPKISIVDIDFDPRRRREYIAATIGQIERAERPLLLFVDPDTGIAPKTAAGEHVTREEIAELWSALKPGEWLVVYQHARREAEWAKKVSAELSGTCGGATVEVAQSSQFGKDVAFLCVCR
ncbi:MAG: hypothetical protein AABO58_13760 [Acidobacteriota bacterium]